MFDWIWEKEKEEKDTEDGKGVWKREWKFRNEVECAIYQNQGDLEVM